MQLDELKKLIKNSNSVLVLENGEPSFVLIGYDTYKELMNEKSEAKEVKIHQGNGGIPVVSKALHERESEILERLNKEIQALRNQIDNEEKAIISAVD